MSMNIKQLAEKLGVAPWTATRYLKQANIPTHKVGRHVVIDDEALIKIRDQVQRYQVMLTRREARELLALIGSRRDLVEVADKLQRISK